MILERAGHDLGGRCGATVHEDDERRAIEEVTGSGVHAEPGIGGAPVGGHDHTVIEKGVRNGDTGLEHSSGVVAQIEHQALQALRTIALESRDGMLEILGRRFAEAGDANVPVARAECGLRDAVHLDVRALQGEVEHLTGARAAHGQPHGGSRLAAHAGDRRGNIRPHVAAIDLRDEIAGTQSGTRGRRALDRVQDLHGRILGGDLDPDARIRAHRAQANFLELVVVQECRMRIETGDHAAHRILEQLVIIDVIDVVALHALEYLGEQVRLFPGQRA